MLETIYKIFYDKDRPKKTKIVWIIIALVILIPTIYYLYTGEHIFSNDNNKNIIINDKNLTTDLKNYTLNLCQELLVFDSNRELGEPDYYEYTDNNEWKTDVMDYRKETLNQYRIRFSNRAANCFYEFEDMGLVNDHSLIIDINDPVNVLVIDYIIEELQGLANKL